MIDVAAVHQAAKLSGLPVRSVRSKGGRCEIVLDEGATPEHVAAANVLAEAATRGEERVSLGGASLSLRSEPKLSVIDAIAVLAAGVDGALSERARAVVKAHAAKLV